jgi:rhodanese-related sulfurtransferase
LAAIYIGYKYWQRRRLLHELRMTRITVSELRQLLKEGKSPLIFDLRSSAALEEDPTLIQGAIHLTMEELEKRVDEFPRDRDVIVYCSCPNEVSSARVALQLQRKGFTRVRPLLGGLDAWREQNLPTEPRPTTQSRFANVSITRVESVHLVGVGGVALKPVGMRPSGTGEGKGI